jgi:hypothetical protein
MMLGHRDLEETTIYLHLSRRHLSATALRQLAQPNQLLIQTDERQSAIADGPHRQWRRAGTLNWSVSSTTADPGKWITVNPTTGVGSGTYTVSVTTSKLPGKGLIAGTYIGQQVLTTGTGNVTIPVSVTVGDPVFVQVGTVTFNTTRGVNPSPKSISVASTGTAIRFTPSAATGKGGTWLHISPSGTACCFTPTSETISVNASALAVGTYVGEINFIEFANPGKSMTIPVVLIVAP